MIETVGITFIGAISLGIIFIIFGLLIMAVDWIVQMYLKINEAFGLAGKIPKLSFFRGLLALWVVLVALYGVGSIVMDAL